MSQHRAHDSGVRPREVAAACALHYPEDPHRRRKPGPSQARQTARWTAAGLTAFFTGVAVVAFTTGLAWQGVAALMLVGLMLGGWQVIERHTPAEVADWWSRLRAGQRLTALRMLIADLTRPIPVEEPDTARHRKADTDAV